MSNFTTSIKMAQQVAAIAASIRSTTSSLQATSTSAPGTEANTSQDGYHVLSEFISKDFRHTSAIFRRFDRLAVRNLLYIESELANLENRLDELDKKQSDDMVDYLQDWPLLCQLAEFGDSIDDQEEAVQRRDLILEIRQKMDEYHRVLKQTCEVFSLQMPGRDDVLTNNRMLHQNWYLNPGTEILKGHMSEHLDNQNDLCVLTPQIQRDPLTRRIEKTAMLRKYFTTEGNVFFTVDGSRSLHRLVTIFSVLLVVLLIVGAVVSLYFWKNDHGRLILLGLLTLLFAGTVSLVTNAHRQDIYSATAAYAAVLVVFIGSALSSDKNGSGNGGSNSSSSTTDSTVASRDLYHHHKLTDTALDIDEGQYATQGLAEDLASNPLLHTMFGTCFIFFCAFVLAALRRNGYRWTKSV